MLLSGAEPRGEIIGSVSLETASDAAFDLPGFSLPGKTTKNDAVAICHQRTLLMLCFVGFIEGADQQLLPATFNALEEDLGLSPTRLGHMSLAQSLFMAASAPFWGAMADRKSRKKLLVFSCLAWAIITILLALVGSTEVMLCLRCVHGAALASLGPISQSVVADITESHQRGAAFGRMYTAIMLGSVMSSLVGTSFANYKVSSGTRGWRLVFAFIASISLLAAVVIQFGMDEPPREKLVQPEANGHQTSRCGSCIDTCRHELRRVMKLAYIPSFDVIVLQGVFGSIPWNAMGFMAMYLHYCGHSDAAAALVVSGLLMGKAVGGTVGGFIGDALARRSPAHGRPLTAQISLLLGIPFTAALVCSAPSSPTSILVCLSFSLGFVASWCSTGVNRPILSEVVDPAGRASIIAWMAACEGTSAALFGAPVVGLLAEQVFGYHKGIKVSELGISGDVLRSANVQALRQAMLWCTIPAWMICCSLFSVLHWTYGNDARNARHAYDRVSDLAGDPEVSDSSPSAERDSRALRRSGASSVASDPAVDVGG